MQFTNIGVLYCMRACVGSNLLILRPYGKNRPRNWFHLLNVLWLQGRCHAQRQTSLKFNLKKLILARYETNGNILIRISAM